MDFFLQPAAEEGSGTERKNPLARFSSASEAEFDLALYGHGLQVHLLNNDPPMSFSFVLPSSFFVPAYNDPPISLSFGLRSYSLRTVKNCSWPPARTTSRNAVPPEGTWLSARAASCGVRTG